jgi:hypothetical protein
MPFKYTPYRNEYVGSITDLMGRGNEAEAQALIASANAQAQAAQVSGQAWGGAVQGIGNTIAAIPGQIQAQQDRKLALEDSKLTRKQREASMAYTDARTASMVAEEQRQIAAAAKADERDIELMKVMENPDRTPEDFVRVLGPQDGITFADGFYKLVDDSVEMLSPSDRSKHLRGIARSMHILSPALKAEYWPVVRAQLLADKRLGLTENDIPEQPDQGFLDGIRNYNVEPADPVPPGRPIAASKDGRPIFAALAPDGSLRELDGRIVPPLKGTGASSGVGSGESAGAIEVAESDRIAKQIYDSGNFEIAKNFTPKRRDQVIMSLLNMGVSTDFFMSSSTTPSIRGAISKLDSTVKLMIANDHSMTQESGMGGKIEAVKGALVGLLRLDPSRELFVGASLSLLPSLARMAGEVGNLAEKEQKLYKRLAPNQLDTLDVRLAKYAAITYLVESARAHMQNRDLDSPALEKDELGNEVLPNGVFNRYLSDILAGDASGISDIQARLIAGIDGPRQSVATSGLEPSATDASVSSIENALSNALLGSGLQRADQPES